MDEWSKALPLTAECLSNGSIVGKIRSYHYFCIKALIWFLHLFPVSNNAGPSSYEAETSEEIQHFPSIILWIPENSQPHLNTLDQFNWDFQGNPGIFLSFSLESLEIPSFIWLLLSEVAETPCQIYKSNPNNSGIFLEKIYGIPWYSKSFNIRELLTILGFS